MIRLERQLDDPKLTHALGLTLGRALRTGDVLCLHGDLGAGKTTLVRAIAEGMGLKPATVSSPTYVIINRYTERAGSEPHAISNTPEVLLHMDAYRLEHDRSGLDDLGFDRAFDRAAACIEWADLIDDRLRAYFGGSWDECVGRVTLEHVDEHARHATIELPAAWGDRDAVDRLVTNPPRFCPRTKEPVAPDARWYPFASERAQQADLFGWFVEAYRVTRPIEEDDLGAAGLDDEVGGY